jgi:hypothetical protein
MRLPPSGPVAAEGWGARLLALRGDDGQWAGGACFPADFRGDFSAAAEDDPDPRLAQAVALVRSKKQPDGRWLLENTHPGAVHFAMEDGNSEPSRWITLRALRVLNWYDDPRSGWAAANSG